MMFARGKTKTKPPFVTVRDDVAVDGSSACRFRWRLLRVALYCRDCLGSSLMCILLIAGSGSILGCESSTVTRELPPYEAVIDLQVEESSVGSEPTITVAPRKHYGGGTRTKGSRENIAGRPYACVTVRTADCEPILRLCVSRDEGIERRIMLDAHVAVMLSFGDNNADTIIKSLSQRWKGWKVPPVEFDPGKYIIVAKRSASGGAKGSGDMCNGSSHYKGSPRTYVGEEWLVKAKVDLDPNAKIGEIREWLVSNGFRTAKALHEGEVFEPNGRSVVWVLRSVKSVSDDKNVLLFFVLDEDMRLNRIIHYILPEYLPTGLVRQR